MVAAEKAGHVPVAVLPMSHTVRAGTFLHNREHAQQSYNDGARGKSCFKSIVSEALPEIHRLDKIQRGESKSGGRRWIVDGTAKLKPV